MPIITSNAIDNMPPGGAIGEIYPITFAIQTIDQIAGLVPVFPCTSTECRMGKDGTDAPELRDDTQFMLPVFAESGPLSPIDTYKNDYNTWLFDFPTNGGAGSSMTFTLEQKINNAWTQVATLNGNTYGTFYTVGALCATNTWKGFVLQWYKVLAAFGEGTFRFKVTLTNFSLPSTCFASPPFCLKTWECYAVDRTVKFETVMSGGRLGNVDKANCGGKYWDFCCTTIYSGSTGTITTSSPITWTDSIRIGGLFGFEDTDVERKINKYSTGVVKKVRDEGILKFEWKSSALPFWFHERFKVYGLFADTLLLSDYNIFNSDYNLKKYCVQADGGYNPKYAHGGGRPGGSRYSPVDVNFKAATQYLIRNRCCSVPTRAPGLS